MYGHFCDAHYSLPSPSARYLRVTVRNELGLHHLYHRVVMTDAEEEMARREIVHEQFAAENVVVRIDRITEQEYHEDFRFP